MPLTLRSQEGQVPIRAHDVRSNVQELSNINTATYHNVYHTRSDVIIACSPKNCCGNASEQSDRAAFECAITIGLSNGNKCQPIPDSFKMEIQLCPAKMDV